MIGLHRVQFVLDDLELGPRPAMAFDSDDGPLFELQATWFFTYQPRWLACAAALGVDPEELSNVDFMCWVSEQAA